MPPFDSSSKKCYHHCSDCFIDSSVIYITRQPKLKLKYKSLNFSKPRFQHCMCNVPIVLCLNGLLESKDMNILKLQLSGLKTTRLLFFKNFFRKSCVYYIDFSYILHILLNSLIISSDTRMSEPFCNPGCMLVLITLLS